MRRLLVLLFLTTALHAATYRNETCGIEFDLPEGWTVGQWEHNWWSHDFKQKDVRCNLGIRPPGWLKKAKASDGFLEKYAIEILVVDRPFKEIAFFGGFMQVRVYTERVGPPPRRLGNLAPDDWLIAVRQGDEAAQQFHTACCQGVRGETWFHSWNSKNEVGTSTSDVVVLNDRKRHSVYIATQIAESFSSPLKRIVDTWRFIR